MDSKRKKITTLILAAAAMVGVMFWTNGNQNDGSLTQPSPQLTNALSDTVTEGTDSDAFEDTDTDSYLPESEDRPYPVTGEIIRTVYEADRDTRDAAIAAAERVTQPEGEMYPAGWIRREPVLINALSITNGNFLDEELVVREFDISPFPDVKFHATMTRYLPFESTMSAQWEGVLDGGVSGSIKISVIGSERGPALTFHLRTPNGHFNILPTDVYGAYVASEPNDAYWREQVVVN